MVDDIKKTFIFNDEVQLVGPGNTHTIRYRIISEDGQRNSEWSAPYTIPAKNISRIASSAISMTASTGYSIATVWSDLNDAYAYDIFVSDGIGLNTTYSVLNNVLTMTTKTAHGFVAGDSINVMGITTPTAASLANVTVLSTPTTTQISVPYVAANNPSATFAGTNIRVESSESNTVTRNIEKGNFRYVGTVVSSGDNQKRYSYAVTNPLSYIESSRVGIQIAGTIKQPDNALVVGISPSVLLVV